MLRQIEWCYSDSILRFMFKIVLQDNVPWITVSFILKTKYKQTFFTLQIKIIFGYLPMKKMYCIFANKCTSFFALYQPDQLVASNNILWQNPSPVSNIFDELDSGGGLKCKPCLAISQGHHM